MIARVRAGITIRTTLFVNCSTGLDHTTEKGVLLNPLVLLGSSFSKLLKCKRILMVIFNNIISSSILCPVASNIKTSTITIFYDFKN